MSLNGNRTLEDVNVVFICDSSEGDGRHNEKKSVTTRENYNIWTNMISPSWEEFCKNVDQCAKTTITLRASSWCQSQPIESHKRQLTSTETTVALVQCQRIVLTTSNIREQIFRNLWSYAKDDVCRIETWRAFKRLLDTKQEEQIKLEARFSLLWHLSKVDRGLKMTNFTGYISFQYKLG